MKNMLIGFVMLALSSCATVAPPPALPEPPVVTEDDLQKADLGEMPTQEEYEKLVISYFNGVLRDPSSAKYKHLGEPIRSSFTHWDRKTNAWVTSFFYCGYVLVNAKNAYGGYSGDKLYYFQFGKNVVPKAFEGKLKFDGLNFVYDVSDCEPKVWKWR